MFVRRGGVYASLSGVESWDASRDARLYQGPHKVVGHPPCGRWGRFAQGGPSHHGRFVVGDDDGCFASCLASVRKFCGVLEHPAASLAWRAFGLLPPAARGWSPAGDWIGWVCAVEQGHYGHRAPKPTWLYVRTLRPSALPELRWGPSNASGRVCVMGRAERERTPLDFARVLVELAEGTR